MSFQHLPFNFLVGELTLCYQLMTLAPWPMCSLLIPHEQIGFHMLLHLTRWSWWWWFKQMKDFTTNDSMDAFLPLDIEVYSCLHWQVDNCFHWCVNMVWSTKRIGDLPLTVLCAVYRQKVSITLHGTQITSILKHVIIASNGSSKLTTFSSFSFRFLIPFFYIYISCD